MFQALRVEILERRPYDSLSIEELRLIGIIQRCDAESFSLYGRSLAELRNDDIWVLGRTALECITCADCTIIVDALRDEVSLRLGKPVTAFDLFTGSGNLLYHMQRALGIRCLGYERDSAVFSATERNLRLVDSEARIQNADYHCGLGSESLYEGDIYILDPPWGRGFSSIGLDLERTSPPVPAILDDIIGARCGLPFTAIIKANDVATESSDRCLREFGTFAQKIVTAGLPEGQNTQYWIMNI